MQGVIAIHGCLFASGVMTGFIFGLDRAKGSSKKPRIIATAMVEYGLICTFPYISLPYLIYHNPVVVKQIFLGRLNNNDKK